MASISSKIKCHQTISGKRVEEIKLKYELMKTHTARRSFATNAFLAGVPTRKIMLCTGHLAEENLRKYIRATTIESAKSLLDIEYFY